MLPYNLPPSRGREQMLPECGYLPFPLWPFFSASTRFSSTFLSSTTCAQTTARSTARHASARQPVEHVQENWCTASLHLHMRFKMRGQQAIA